VKHLRPPKVLLSYSLHRFSRLVALALDRFSRRPLLDQETGHPFVRPRDSDRHHLGPLLTPVLAYTDGHRFAPTVIRPHRVLRGEEEA